MRKSIVSGFVLAAALAAGSTADAAMPLFECGATIPPEEKAVLQNDVVCRFRCSGDPTILCTYLDEEDACLGNGVCEPEFFTLGRGAVLDLGGHTIEAAYQSAGVQCGSESTTAGRCVVKNGTIVGGKGVGVASLGLDIVVQDLTIGTMDYAIFGRGRVVARRLAIASGRENAVLAERDIDLRDVVMDGEWVIRSGRNLRNVTSGPGFWGDTASLIAADRRLRLVHADVVSVESGRKPRLVHTTCERSTVAGAPGVSWGVCALDP